MMMQCVIITTAVIDTYGSQSKAITSLSSPHKDGRFEGATDGGDVTGWRSISGTGTGAARRRDGLGKEVV